MTIQSIKNISNFQTPLKKSLQTKSIPFKGEQTTEKGKENQNSKLNKRKKRDLAIIIVGLAGLAILGLIDRKYNKNIDKHFSESLKKLEEDNKKIQEELDKNFKELDEHLKKTLEDLK